MKVRSLILFLLLFITAALPLRAQWSGSADLSAGLGGMTGNDELGVGLLGHVLTKGDATLSYRTENYSPWVASSFSWASSS